MHIGILVKGSSSNSTWNDSGCEAMPYLYYNKMQHKPATISQTVQCCLTAPVVSYKGLYHRSPDAIVSLTAFLDVPKINMHLEDATNSHLYPVNFILN